MWKKSPWGGPARATCAAKQGVRQAPFALAAGTAPASPPLLVLLPRPSTAGKVYGLVLLRYYPGGGAVAKASSVGGSPAVGGIFG